MKLTYKHTRIACYANFFSTAVCIALMGLLLTSLRREFGLDMGRLSLLVGMLSLMQIILVPVMTAAANRAGFRPMMIFAQVFFFSGIFGLGMLPYILPNPYAGLLSAVILYAIGMGTSEAINSAVIESLPSDNKGAEMARLHAVFPGAQLAVIVLTTAYFGFISADNWRVLPIAYSVVPLLNFFLCLKAPFAPAIPEESKMKFSQIVGNKIFLFMVLFIFFEGFVELCMSQWASMFAEAGLGVNKALGGLLGPGLITLGVLISRSIFGVMGDRLPIEKCMIGCSLLCFAAHMIVAFAANPFVCLLGVGLNGLGVGFLFPALFVIAPRALPNAGVLLFGSLSASTYIGITFSSWLMGLMTAYAETHTIPLLSAVIPAKSAVEMGMRSTFFVVGIIVLLMLACLLLTFAAIKQKNAKSESECRLLQQESI